VVPSIINENAKKHVFPLHKNIIDGSAEGLKFFNSFGEKHCVFFPNLWCLPCQ
jgi:hypothetical protein